MHLRAMLFNAVRRSPALRRAIAALLLPLTAGCATVPYRCGTTYADPRAGPPLAPEAQIVRGRPHWLLDRSDCIWPGSWLGKLVLWDRRVDNHAIRPETEAVLRRYLEINELRQVQVRLNAYHVRDEWRRLVHNRSVGAGWRYTLGVLSWLQYTLLPGRFFGGDHFNPYTNTIHLYSDIPAIAVHEAGHAKDFADRRWKGTYAFLYVLPLVSLYHEARATNDALGYLLAEESPALQREGYRILYPAYGTYLGGGLGDFVPVFGTGVYVAAIVGGHVLGRFQSSAIADPPRPAPGPTPTDGAREAESAR